MQRWWRALAVKLAWAHLGTQEPSSLPPRCLQYPAKPGWSGGTQCTCRGSRPEPGAVPSLSFFRLEFQHIKSSRSPACSIHTGWRTSRRTSSGDSGVGLHFQVPRWSWWSCCHSKSSAWCKRAPTCEPPVVWWCRTMRARLCKLRILLLCKMSSFHSGFTVLGKLRVSLLHLLWIKFYFDLNRMWVNFSLKWMINVDFWIYHY